MNLVKWKFKKPSELKKICKRIQNIKKTKPLGVCVVYQIGITHHPRGAILRIEMQKEYGTTLKNLFPLSFVDKLNLLDQGIKCFLDWQKKSFIHGDLSPSNILVERNQIRFVDFVLNLDSYESTPRYCDPEIFMGQRTIQGEIRSFKKLLLSF